jgi:hypothetical protein
MLCDMMLPGTCKYPENYDNWQHCSPEVPDVAILTVHVFVLCTGPVCVCVCVDVYVSIYIYIYIYMYMCVYVYMYVY